MEDAAVVKVIDEEVIARFGVCGTIHSDQGTQFEGHLFTEICKLLYLKITLYHPQSDGMMDRFNKNVAEMLSVYVNNHHSDWDEYVLYVMMAQRCAANETTGTSPIKMMLGCEVSTALDIAYKMPQEIKRIPPNTWVLQLQGKWEELRDAVTEITKYSTQRQKWYHDRN